MNGKDIFIGLLYSSPMIGVVMFLIIAEIKLTPKPSCYERSISNKKKLDKKLVKNDLKFIKDKINYMIKEGETFNYFVYEPGSGCKVIEYIKDYKLFNDCRIDLIQVDTSPFKDKIHMGTAIQIEFLK